MKGAQRAMNRDETVNTDVVKQRVLGEKREEKSVVKLKIKKELGDECYRTTVKCEVLEDNEYKLMCEGVPEDAEINGEYKETIKQIKDEQEALHDSPFCYVNCLDYHHTEESTNAQTLTMQVYNHKYEEKNDTENKQGDEAGRHTEPLNIVKIEIADNCDITGPATYRALTEHDFKVFGESVDVYGTENDMKEIEDNHNITDTSQHDPLSINPTNNGITEMKNDNKCGTSDACKVHSNKKVHTCRICGRQFNHRCSLSLHRRTHTNDLAFACEECGKAFKLKRYLNKHYSRVHTNIHPFVCEVCDKSFLDKCLLTRHSKIHTGERPFMCETCGKNFIRKFNLMQHEMTHKGERSYSCEICSKRFTFKSNLVQHRQTHTDERPFTCEFCGTRFRFKSDWRRHLKKKHDKKHSPQNLRDNTHLHNDSSV